MLVHIEEFHHGGDRIWTVEDREELLKDPHRQKQSPVKQEPVDKREQPVKQVKQIYLCEGETPV
jgi:hypothetical protein